MDEETIKNQTDIIKSAAEPGGRIKTMTDLKIEKMEARIEEIIRMNRELIEANKELYAYAQSVQTAAAVPSEAPKEAPKVQPAEIIGEPEQPKKDVDILYAETMKKLGFNVQSDGM